MLSALLSAADWLANFECEEFVRCGESFADVLIDGVHNGTHGVLDCAYLESSVLPPLGMEHDEYLRTATELINNRGYRGVSADLIRREFCLKSGSIMLHSEESHNIVDRCFERSRNIIRAAHRAMPRHSKSGWSRLCSIVAFIARHQHLEHGPLLRYYALSILPYADRLRWTDEINRLESLISGVLTDGVIDGSIKGLDTIIAGKVTIAFLNAIAESGHWVPNVKERDIVRLFVRPILLGLVCSSE